MFDCKLMYYYYICEVFQLEFFEDMVSYQYGSTYKYQRVLLIVSVKLK